MRRFQLHEIEDQPWCPTVLRDLATDYLRAVLTITGVYDAALPVLESALRETSARQVLDLCSGAGGPWPSLYPRLRRALPTIKVLLSDRHPNLDAAGALLPAEFSGCSYHPEPVDALNQPTELEGFRTLFTAFHHFDPAQGRAILESAVESGSGIALFEVTNRSWTFLAGMFLTPLAVLVITPLIRPLSWMRMAFTYLVPAVPLFTLFDGVVSVLRSYTPKELLELATEADPSGRFTWKSGAVSARVLGFPIPITYLVGTSSNNT